MCCWNNCKSFNDPTRRELFLKGDSSIFSRGAWGKVRKSLIRLASMRMCTAAYMHRGVASCPLLFSNPPDTVRDTSSITGDTGDVGESSYNIIYVNTYNTFWLGRVPRTELETESSLANSQTAQRFYSFIVGSLTELNRFWQPARWDLKIQRSRLAKKRT